MIFTKLYNILQLVAETSDDEEGVPPTPDTELYAPEIIECDPLPPPPFSSILLDLLVLPPIW